MKKHHFIKMSSLALSLCVTLGMVVYSGNADDGYINFDCVHISKSA